MNFQRIHHSNVKHGFTTHAVPVKQMAGTRPFDRAPEIGDLLLAKVLTVGQHAKIESRTGALWHLFPNDMIMGAFGNRYAPDQFEAYVPKEMVAECDLMSVGGVCGQVASKHPSMDAPTRIRVLGGVCDEAGGLLNLRSFGLPPREATGQVTLVVGSSMNAGKTTAVGTLARALRQAGFRVAAAKVTGTAAGKDSRYFSSCGAKPVLDFTDAGYPSTYLLELPELLGIFHTLVGHLRDAKPDHILIEVADGIHQRETRMLLDCAEFRQSVEHVFFAASDSLSAECGARCMQSYGLPLRALAGAFTQSTLAVREAEGATGFPCLSIERMMTGGVFEAIERSQATPRIRLPLPLLDERIPPPRTNGEAAERTNGKAAEATLSQVAVG